MAEELISSDPQSITNAQYQNALRGFIEECQFTQLESLVLLPAASSQHFSFYVSSNELIDHDPALGYTVIHHPKLLLPIFEAALIEAQRLLVKHSAFSRKYNGSTWVVKDLCHVRLRSLPPVGYLHKATISDIRTENSDSLLQICGTLVRVGTVRMLEVSKQYECQNARCRHRFTVVVDPEQVGGWWRADPHE